MDNMDNMDDMDNPAMFAPQAIAIIGIGLRLPGEVRSLDDYWQLLCGEHSTVSRRADADGPAAYCASIEKETFDNNFFNISDREVQTLDPQQQLLLETSWEAFENANIVPTTLAGSKVGVFFGLSGVDNIINLVKEGTLDAYLGTGNSHAAAAGRIAYYFGFCGPALAIDTACSSSLAALHLAAISLRSFETDTAVVGSVNLVQAPEFSNAFALAKMLSPQGQCKALSNEADGYVRGEGCIVLVVKRYEDALRDHDHIQGVVLGSALNQDGASAGLVQRILQNPA